MPKKKSLKNHKQSLSLKKRTKLKEMKEKEKVKVSKEKRKKNDLIKTRTNYHIINVKKM